MVRAMLEQSSINAPSSLAALRQRPDNTLPHVQRRLSQMVEEQLCPEDTLETSDKFRATTSTVVEVGHQIPPNRWPTL
jgi:hypothetical protein